MPQPILTLNAYSAHISQMHLYVSFRRYYDKPNMKYFHILDSSEYSRDISIVKLSRCTNVSNLFYFIWGNTLHASDDLYVHHQEFKTVHTATDICQTDTADCLLARSRQFAVGSNCLTYACCFVYSLELLMMDGKTFRNMYIFTPNKIK